ncbi:beta-ketoacyl synthase N-terminal-like domain-containing protein [Kitasatospora sp. NPDC018058]|uniref:beta-ketoacyl synthase N-terminal-like domain-containing protein n=1 Tax=Kitasatospora sp. NPDC018058 TaxID=3364025 RepID=UPI0037C144F3
MTAALPATGNPVISGWSAVSPFGLGREVFREGLRAGWKTATDLDAGQWATPDAQACLVPDFSVRELLGRKGTRDMDRVTGLAVIAVGRLLGGDEGYPAVPTGEDTALVLGTTTGSAESMMGYTRTSMQKSKPFLVDPALMPNAVMNCAAGQCAIRHGLKGPNTTIAGGQSAGLFALNYARRLLASGRAGKVLCGAAEEFSQARSWLEHHRRGPEHVGTVLGEGSAMFLLEDGRAVAPDRPPLAEVLGVHSRVHLRGDIRSALVACVSGALEVTGVQPEEVWAVVPSGAQRQAAEQERAALDQLFPDSATRRIEVADLLGDTGAAGAAFQISAALSTAQDHPDAAGRVAVITSTDVDGSVACALIRLLGDR